MESAFAADVRSAATAGATPRVLAPDPATLFAARARRFRELADGHALGGWLRFLGRIAEAQHMVLKEFGRIPLSDADAVERARRYGMPLAPAQEWRPHPLWRNALHTIIATTYPEAPRPAQKSLAQLGATVPGRLDALAQRVLHAALLPKDADTLPYVAAALQVVWTSAAATLGSVGMRPLDVPGVCPCCGSLPVGSVVRNVGEVANLRYLHCSLCNTEWHLVRVKCPTCEAGAHVSYRHIEGSDLSSAPAMRAETCDDCMSYLKILYLEKEPRGDPVADDLATLALDVLVDAAGYRRAGPNPLFVPGAG